MLRRQRQTWELTSKSSEWRGIQHNPETPIPQALEDSTRSVDEDDGGFSLCFFKKEMETRMETRSAEMFLVHASVFPFDKRGITYVSPWMSQTNRQDFILPGSITGTS